MTIDILPLWDFQHPEVSEQRFSQALASAVGDDALILQTQIARTWGLRKDFDKARAVLRPLEPSLASAGPEARVRYMLELGRTCASAAHTPEQLTPEAKTWARRCYDSALQTARQAGLDALAIDAIHMFAFVDTSPTDQLEWAQAALDVSLASSQADAQGWEATIRNNLGMALHGLGRYDEALLQFEQAVVLRESGGDAGRVRVAHWMVAWTLRGMGRTDDALAIQLRLEKAFEAAGETDPYVFEELEALYRSKGDTARAGHYAKLNAAANATPP